MLDVSEKDAKALVSLGILEEVEALEPEPEEPKDPNLLGPETPEPPEATKDHESLEKVNVNTSPVEKIELLTGVGAATAKKLIEARPFDNLDSLKAFNSKVRWDELKEQIEF